MRRNLSISLILSFLVSLSTPNTWATPTPRNGAPCNKVNQTISSASFKYICKKSGKKLLWTKTRVSNQSNQSAMPAPTSIPTVTPAPTPTPATTSVPTPKIKSFVVPLLPSTVIPITWKNLESRASDISSVAWQSAQDTLKANSSSGATTSIKVIYAPNTPTSHYSGFENYLRTGVALWNRFILPPKSAFLVYSYDEIPWAKSEITKILTDSGMSSNQAQQVGDNLSRAPYGGPDCGGANAGMISENQAIGVFGLCARNEGTDPYYVGPLQIHEFTHQMQGAQFIGSNLNSQQILPCWISEGLAHAAGLSAGTNNLNAYLDVRKRQASHPVLNVAGGHSSTQVDASTITYEFLTKFYAESSPPSCFALPSYSLGYSVGFLTTEALSAIGGIESTLLLYSRAATGESFEEAFKNIYGISWVDASDILAKAVSKEFLLIR